MPEKPTSLTTEEFEALLFEVYKKGYTRGARYGYWVDSKVPEEKVRVDFNELMYEFKLKTIIK
jgi:hypothetical protein